MPIITCSSCGKPVSSEAENCIHCKKPLIKSSSFTNYTSSFKNPNDQFSTSNMVDDEKTNRYRYPALRFIARVYLLLSIIALAGSLALGFYIGDKLTPQLGLLYFLISLFFALLILALSESIMVFLDIEYNTRKCANELRRRFE
jgi:hypothetical protein